MSLQRFAQRTVPYIAHNKLKNILLVKFVAFLHVFQLVCLSWLLQMIQLITVIVLNALKGFTATFAKVDAIFNMWMVFVSYVLE